MIINIGNIIGAFITLVKTYDGFIIIVVAALILFFAIMIFDRRGNKRQ